jgi:hypothetical protein
MAANRMTGSQAFRFGALFSLSARRRASIDTTCKA